jgi:hypothetical protein
MTFLEKENHIRTEDSANLHFFLLPINAMHLV